MSTGNVVYHFEGPMEAFKEDIYRNALMFGMFEQFGKGVISGMLKDGYISGAKTTALKEPVPDPREEPEMTDQQAAAYQETEDQDQDQFRQTAAKPAEPEKAKRTRRTKAEIEAAAAAQEPAKQGNGAAEKADDSKVIAIPTKIVRDDLVKLAKRYEGTYGYEALEKDMKAELFNAVGVRSLGKVPDDQENLQRAFKAMARLVQENPFEREAL